MFVDHIGLLFVPEIEIFNVIGRISFPLFAFLIAEGFNKTSDANRYLKRLFIFAIISQLPFSYFYYISNLTDIYKLNILFTLSAGLLILILIKRKSYKLLTASCLLVIILEIIIGFDYGIYGILLILFSYIFIKQRDLGLLLIVLLTVLFSLNFNSIGDSYFQIFALLSVFPIMVYNNIIGKRVSKWWFYGIYPVHFVVLILIFHLL